MTEAQWHACAEPDDMLELLLDRVSERKLRLFACACCRSVGHLITVPQCRAALAVAEEYADDRAGLRQLHDAWSAAQKAKPVFLDANWCAVWVAAPAVVQAVAQASVQVAEVLARAAAETDMSAARASVCSGAPPAVRARAWAEYEASVERATAEFRRQQADLLRCIAGNPFRPFHVEPEWHGWNGGTVPLMAREIYDSGCFGDLPLLGDALEEAGCGDEAVLDHCHGAGEHARGCHVLDGILGRV